MDSVIMDGRDLSVGGVACCTSVSNPISLARRVKDETEHCLIVGQGADQIARKFGIKYVSTEELTTPAENAGHDTVGCVALDAYGNLAAGTSTGGITAKTPGRVGDSPIIGSGAYADNLKGGVSTTGHGESIAKMCLAKGIVDILPRERPCVTAKAFSTPRMCWASIEATGNGLELYSGIDPDKIETFSIETK
eukprot:GSChrysophyteH1.ASY1.ANO1.818.1 assembled CDS